MALRRAEAERQARYERIAGYSRVAVFALGVLLAWSVLAAGYLAPAWLAIPLVLFIAFVIWHQRIELARNRAARGLSFYERGLDRQDGRWKGNGEPGTRFLDPNHPSACDLDLFGPGSMFERLCQARTRDGQATLAAWLMSPARAEEIAARHAAVAELQPRLDLREDLDILGANVRSVVDPDGLTAWATAQPLLNLRTVRWVVFVLSVLAVGTLVIWLASGVGRPAFLIAVISEIGVSMWLRRRVRKVIGSVARKARDLELFATILARLEGEQFHCPRLRLLRAGLDAAGLPPSVRIAHLGRLIERLNWRNNQIFAPFAALLLWATQHAFALEAWRAVSGAAIARWLYTVGEFEALCSLSAYAFENPGDPFPQVVEDGALFDGDGLGHPLLSAQHCVRNDVRLGGDGQLLVVSGSNMSGKSTLLRTVGVNAVLALAGAPVRARRLSLSPVVVGATMRIEDSLEAGRSRFYTEITRIRRFVELAADTPPLLFLLDELFQGTNSHDRRLGAEAVVRALVDAGAIGLITTHDLALTQIADGLGTRARNVHFEDRFNDGAITFDYCMRPGIVQRGNALALMRAVGLEVPPDGAGLHARDDRGQTPVLE